MFFFLEFCLLISLVWCQIPKCNVTNGFDEYFIRKFTVHQQCEIDDGLILSNQLECRGIACFLSVDYLFCVHHTDNTWACGNWKNRYQNNTRTTKIHRSVRRWEYIPDSGILNWEIDCPIEDQKILSRLCVLKVHSNIDQIIDYLLQNSFVYRWWYSDSHLGIGKLFLNLTDPLIQVSASFADAFEIPILFLDWFLKCSVNLVIDCRNAYMDFVKEISFIDILFPGLFLVIGLYFFSIFGVWLPSNKKKVSSKPTEYSHYKPIIPPAETEENDEMCCLICKDKKKLWCAQPCGHITSCHECHQNYKQRNKCPLCRQDTQFWVIVRI